MLVSAASPPGREVPAEVVDYYMICFVLRGIQDNLVDPEASRSRQSIQSICSRFST